MSDLNDLQKFIVDWSRKTFGPPNQAGQASKLAKEAEELKNHPGDLKEMADIMVVLLQLAAFSGHTADDLIDAVVRKMQVNMARKWERQPDGSFQHVEGT